MDLVKYLYEQINEHKNVLEYKTVPNECGNIKLFRINCVYVWFARYTANDTHFFIFNLANRDWDNDNEMQSLQICNQVNGTRIKTNVKKNDETKISLSLLFGRIQNHNKICKVRDVRGASNLFWLNKDLKWKTIIIHWCEWFFFDFVHWDNEQNEQTLLLESKSLSSKWLSEPKYNEWNTGWKWSSAHLSTHINKINKYTDINIHFFVVVVVLFG